MEKTDNLTIGLVGAGGDGVVVLGSLLQRLAASQGYFGQMPKYYGAQIRGGGSAVKLNLNSLTPSLPKDELDVLVCFNWEKYFEFRDELPIDKDTIVMYENEPVGEIILPKNSFRIPFTEISVRVTGERRNKNVLALGLLAEMILGLPLEKIKTVIEGDAKFSLLKKTFPVFESGKNLLAEFSGLPKIELVSPQAPSSKIILSGNEVIVMAAIYAGCRAFFGYPITPATEIMEEMAEKLSKIGGVFRQSEDEIAAVNNGIGASLAGVKSLIATSGPGMSLATEAMALAVSLEVPMVIVDAQRAGPSTGVPSKTEQSDLYHAVFGGHGDAPRIVLSPYDVESAYRLVIKGFNLSEYYQTLVIILSDQLLSQTPVSLDDDFLKREYPIIGRKKPSEAERDNYRRYEETGDYVSPMSSIGDEGGVYQTAGLSHTADGSHEPDFKTLEQWHEKLSRKLEPVKRRNDLVKLFGNLDSVNRIIAWGSTAQAVMAAVEEAGLKDKVAVCVPELIYPLPDRVEEFVRSAESLLVIEMNSSGQFYHYLRSQIDVPKNTVLYKRSGAKPFNISELVKPIEEFVRLEK